MKFWKLKEIPGNYRFVYDFLEILVILYNSKTKNIGKSKLRVSLNYWNFKNKYIIGNYINSLIF